MRHYLALDWGERKVGMALADGETCIAFAYATVPMSEKIGAVISDVIAEYDVSMILVGVPSHRAHGNNGVGARDFAAMIAARFPSVQVRIADEMFTTKMALAHRRDAGKRGSDDDAEAARILLQEWCDAAKA